MKKKLPHCLAFFSLKNCLIKITSPAFKKCFFVFILLFLIGPAFLKLSAQTINDDGNQHHVGYTGTHQDFIVPNNPLLIKIGIRLYGADGGAAQVRLVVPLIGTVLNTCNSGGGAGAFTSVVFLVGSGPGKIPYGSTIRFVIGQKGTSGQDDVFDGVGSEYGGGGGGTAVLYLPPSGSTWILLAVAGGGGGAYVGMIAGLCAITEPGGAGRESENGGDAPGIVGGSGYGGTGGGGGGSSAYGTGAGGGGAYVRGGSVPCIDGDLNVHDIGEGGAGRHQLTGAEEGGYGGTSEGCTSLLLGWRNGGYGYGGGGGGVGVGGGGGGYSGGGSGTLACGGGGGGSFFHSMREYGIISGGGNTTNPSEGFANYKVTLNQPPVAICKSATVYLSATGAASIVVSDINNGSNDPDGDALTFSLSKSNFTCSDIGTNNVTLTVTDINGATATCVAIVTVIDNLVPIITCPADIMVSCAANVPQVNVASVTVIDNCAVVVTHVSDVVTNQTCANRFTLTRTYRATDASGNSSTCQQVITVADNSAPQITNLSVSQPALWPPNHTMRDITVDYQVTDNCTIPVTTISVNSNEPVNGTGDGDTDPDWEIIDAHHLRLRAERAATGNGRIYTITITANDGCNATVVSSIQVNVAHNITGPASGKPFVINSTVPFSGHFYDKLSNRHTAKWLLDGATVSNGSVTEPSSNQNGKVTGSYKFTSAGVYKLQMNVTDQTGQTSYANMNGDLDAIVVIYDPNGGYTYGGGWFPSIAGALTDNPSATGKGSFGFAVNYRNAPKPKGETQFEFKLGSFEFNALNFDYLVVSGYKAQFRGTGKIIGGQSGINFIMTVTDGRLDGSDVDKIRLKIFRNNNQVIYDNQPGESDAADPIQPVGTNSIIYIDGIVPTPSFSKAITVKTEEVKQIDALKISAFPNPSHKHFTLQVKSSNAKDKILMQVSDENGRLMETRNNVVPGSVMQLGERFKPGVYVIKAWQGNNYQYIKLVKL